jgi:hypothetical protein
MVSVFEHDDEAAEPNRSSLARRLFGSTSATGKHRRTASETPCQSSKAEVSGRPRADTVGCGRELLAVEEEADDSELDIAQQHQRPKDNRPRLRRQGSDVLVRMLGRLGR